MLLVYSMFVGIGVFTGIGCLMLVRKRVCPLIVVFVKARLPCVVSLARRKSSKSFVPKMICRGSGHRGPRRPTSPYE